MNDNPFAVDPSCCGSASGDRPDPRQFQIEGSFLICGPILELPEICLLSGGTRDLRKRRVNVDMRPFRLTNSVRTCEVRYWIGPRGVRNERLIAAGIVLYTIPIVLLFSLGGTSGKVAALILSVILIVLQSVFRGWWPVVELFVERFEPPDRFWISGLNEQVLQTLKQWTLDHSQERPLPNGQSSGQTAERETASAGAR